MLRIIQNSRASVAKSYFATSDYYSEGQELKGIWRGKGAELLGLSGEIRQQDWDRLCDNLDPRTGESLTVRQKANRRIGYDMNFHCPKSVSVLYGMTQDERIVGAFRDAVNATMNDMEAEMQTRVRKGGTNTDRPTCNMVWGEYVHTTARPVEGVPDPHLHIHAFAFNTTFDPVEKRWKAGEFSDIKRDASYFEALFHSRLSRNLTELGLPIERTTKGWEISGVPASVVQKFSRRTAQIEAKAKELGITDPEQKGELGAKTRNRKQKQLGMGELRELWQARLTPQESEAVQALADRIGSEPLPQGSSVAKEAVTRAIGHVFERKSVIPERTLVAEALKGTYGQASLADVEAELATRDLLRAERGGQRCVTTKEVLAEERRLLAFAREGRGRYRSLAPGEHVFQREWLNKGQRNAVRHVLESRDRVMLIRGAAGVGKTSMMQEAAEAIEASGKRVFAFAQSSGASAVLREQAGFKEATTVATLFVNEKLQEQMRGQVCWIDEASQLSAPDIVKLFGIAERVDARVVLSGDRRQHGSVQRGSVLRMLEEEAGLVPAEITEIQRQESARYKEAVWALSEGKVEEGLRELDALGWIRELPDGEERYQVLASDYVGTVAGGKTALVVSPTHKEADAITLSIRSELKARGLLGKEEHELQVLTNKNLTEAERTDARNFADGDVMVFHQNAKGFTKGDRVPVGDDKPPLAEAARFQLYRSNHLSLAEGDRIRITKNGKTLGGGHALHNGDLYTVSRFDDHGNLVLSNGWTVAKDYEHMTYGYVVTSHASQGQTVKKVIIGQSYASMPAASREQFYVSVSRGQESAVIYTDSKDELLEGVKKSEDRLTATELLRERALLASRQQEVEQVLQRGREREQDLLERAHG